MKSIPLRAHEAAAYAAGRLTQLRRVCRPQPSESFLARGVLGVVLQWPRQNGVRWFMADGCSELVAAPYGAPGDRLALRETWRVHIDADQFSGNELAIRSIGQTSIISMQYRSDLSTRNCTPSGPSEFGRWRSPITQPLWAVRWHPVITAVRLERVQDISEADARACGSYIGRCECMPRSKDRAPIMAAFKMEWCHIHNNEYSVQFTRDNPRTPWDSNPWTWVYEVEGVKG